MLSQKTAAALYNCHQQIVNAEQLLQQTKESILKDEDRFSEYKGLIDAFGSQKRRLELGIPSGSSGSRLVNVDPDLAVIIIEAQIGKYKSQLGALNQIAALECIVDDKPITAPNDERSVATGAESETK